MRIHVWIETNKLNNLANWIKDYKSGKVIEYHPPYILSHRPEIFKGDYVEVSLPYDIFIAMKDKLSGH